MLRFAPLFLVACTYDRPPLEFAVSPDYTPEQLEVVASAVAEWDGVSPYALTVRVGAPAPGQYHIAPGPKRDNPDGTIQCGLVEDYQVTTRCHTPARFRCTVLHELGHVFGLEHRDGTFMAAMRNPEKPCTLSEGDKAYCRASGVCRDD